LLPPPPFKEWQPGLDAVAGSKLCSLFIPITSIVDDFRQYLAGTLGPADDFSIKPGVDRSVADAKHYAFNGVTNMPKLNQILAIEKGIKTKAYAEVTDLHKSTQKPTLMNGFHKSYQPKDESGDMYPPESQKVQINYEDAIRRVRSALTELFDVTATKDWTKADVIVEGRTIIRDVPAPYLLFLEKQLSDLQTFVAKLVELDPGSDWSYDPSSGLHKTQPMQTQRTKKVQRAIVLYDATEHHPAQTQLISDDVVVGYWNTIKHSGAIPRPKKLTILERIEKLAKAVKFAREQANAAEAEQKEVGKEVFDYLFEE
jgi:hypothetical protein